jgi:hypothetical protein
LAYRIPKSLAIVGALLSALILPAAADASRLIARNPKNVQLAVDRTGTAMVSYRDGRLSRHVLAWGAINARVPNPNVRQVRFKLDYAGGWGRFRRLYWRSFRNTCKPYDGPKLAWFVAACKAPDGSYWALQSWQTPLPDLGFAPWTPALSTWELHLSHWTGPLAQLEVWTDWIYGGKYHDLFGRLFYRGNPVHGFHTTRIGAPTDGYGRLLYLDTYNAAAYGPGWRRENSFVAHKPTGVFCYGFYRFNPFSGGYIHPPWYRSGMRGPGNGEKYRITVEGPGVTPDVVWIGNGLHDYDRSNPDDVAYELQMNGVLDSILNGDRLCRQH